MHKNNDDKKPKIICIIMILVIAIVLGYIGYMIITDNLIPIPLYDEIVNKYHALN